MNEDAGEHGDGPYIERAMGSCDGRRDAIDEAHLRMTPLGGRGLCDETRPRVASDRRAGVKRMRFVTYGPARRPLPIGFRSVEIPRSRLCGAGLRANAPIGAGFGKKSRRMNTTFAESAFAEALGSLPWQVMNNNIQGKLVTCLLSTRCYFLNRHKLLFIKGSLFLQSLKRDCLLALHHPIGLCKHLIAQRFP
ncbi:hypothetical protein [Pararobbsia silviterrae]|uniref:hypothetical protein n=1 Tax=Pararobbsia silviterrae TaxID=1792498 RepID=UPI001982339A|nr:hypothetical protein [Pararobbsia silviterrae]